MHLSLINDLTVKENHLLLVSYLGHDDNLGRSTSKSTSKWDSNVNSVRVA